MSNKNNQDQSSKERLQAEIISLSERAKLDSWSDFIRELKVPGDIYPAMATLRPALMPKGRALTAEECQVLYDIIATLMETNAALKSHTEQTAILVKDWTKLFNGIITVAHKIEDFANFRRVGDSDDDAEERAA